MIRPLQRPLHSQSRLADSDADFVGDACDKCPDDIDPGRTDTVMDGTGDVCD